MALTLLGDFNLDGVFEIACGLLQLSISKSQIPKLIKDERAPSWFRQFERLEQKFLGTLGEGIRKPPYLYL